MMTGISLSAQACIAFVAVAAEPVKEILSTPARHSASPVAPNPVTSCSTGASGTTCANTSASQAPAPGVCSLGLNTTALPAARAYAMEPTKVNTG